MLMEGMFDGKNIFYVGKDMMHIDQVVKDVSCSGYTEMKTAHNKDARKLHQTN